MRPGEDRRRRGHLPGPLIGAAIVLFGGGCHERVPVTAAEGDVVAVVDGQAITVKDLEARLDAMSPYLKARYAAAERKKDFLDNLVRFEVLVDEARREGLDRDPEVVQQVKEEMVHKLMTLQLDRQVKMSDISDADIAGYYASHDAEFNTPDERRFTIIVVKDQSQAASVAAQAKALAPADNLGYRQLVEKLSEDPVSKAREGDTEYVRADAGEDMAGGLPPEVRAAGFAIPSVDGVAGPIKTAQGYYVIKLVAEHPAVHHTLADASERIRMELYRDRRTQAMNDWVARLRQQADVHVYDDKLAEVKIDIEPDALHGGAIPSTAAPVAPSDTPVPAQVAPVARPPHPAL